MEIDPQLQHADKNGADARPSYLPSRQAPTTRSEYPEPPGSAPWTLTPRSRGTPPDDPASFAPEPDQGPSSTEPNDPVGDLKRPRACEPCRQLKVRCDPDPDHPAGSCKRCAKARRTCVVTAPTRKRQKKTDSRVAELERKIDALTATLQASPSTGALFPAGGPPAQQQQQRASPLQHREDQHAGRRWLVEEPTLAGSKRRHSGELKGPPDPARPVGGMAADQGHRRTASVHWRGPYGGETAPSKTDAGSGSADVIDRGIVDVPTATAAFERYVQHLAVEMPVVVFPPETQMSDVRRNKPALFLAILAVAIGPLKPEVQLALFAEIYRVLADRIVVNGEKSLELVQVLLVCCTWYMPPDNFEELKFYQLIHMAVAMAMDLGLNRRPWTTKKPFMLLRELIGKKSTASSFDPDGPEARRTWVACYFSSVQVSTAMRRVHLVRWQPYMDDSLGILEKHPDALPSDRRLVWWAKLGLIMEEAGALFTSDDHGSIPSFADHRVRYKTKALATQLAQWRRDVPEEFYTVPMAHTQHVINLFVHEAAMNIDANSSSIPNSSAIDDLSSSAMSALIDALTTCIRSIHQSLDIVVSIDVDRFICLPTVSVARTSYTVVSLIKIYSLLTTPETRLGQAIDLQSLKLDYYLDKVIDHYRAAAARDGGRAASKFGHILAMLRTWFLKKKDLPALKEVFGSDQRAQTPGDKQPMKPGTTPLHLLSEVAMGDPAHRASSTGSFSHPSQPTPGHPYSSSTGLTPGAPDTTTPTPGPSHLRPANAPPHLNPMAVSKPSNPQQPSWPSAASASSFPPSLPGHPDLAQTGSKAFYQPFTTNPSPPYSSLQSSTPPMQAQQGYPDMSAPTSAVGGMHLAPALGPGPVPDFGADAAFDQDNLFALGSLMDESLFSFPFSFDGNFEL